MNNIIKRIDAAKHIVVIAHMNPDADSLGSASAIYTHLLRLHKKVSFFCATKNIDQKLSFIPWFDKIRDSFPSSADLAISLDCGDIRRFGVDVKCDLINIDHHESNSKFGEIFLVDDSCISTTHVLFNFFKENEISINKKMATALYAGLLDDSNGFLSDEVDGTVFAVSRELIECGAEYKLCNKFIMKYQTLACMKLKASMITNMTLVNDAKVALFLVTNEDIDRCGAIGEDCKIALEESLYLPTVELAILLRENPDSSLKGSLRSSGEFNVSTVASQLNGGGHKSRAGFALSNKYTLQSGLKEVLKLINGKV